MRTPVIFLALRNLVLQRRRYLMIGAAVALGFLLITVLSGTAYGAMETVKSKAARYFSGHVSVTGYAGSWPQIDDPDAVLALLRSSDLPIRLAAKRTIYYKSDARLLFGGETVQQRRLIGVDFTAEREIMETLALSSGSLRDMVGERGRNGILISDSAARLLGARLGDDVNIVITTDTGQYGTAAMVVRGIFSESGLFGFVAYVGNEDLNRLLWREPGSATDIALYAEAGADPSRLSRSVRDVLAGSFDTYPYLTDKVALRDALAEDGDGLAVLSLDAHLAQITSILDAFLLVTYFVLVIFVAIVMVGILNTYRVIVYERTREIGTMRALGMTRRSVAALFLAEAVGLAVVASAVGLLLGIVGLVAVGLVDLGGVPASGMFTEGGRLRFYLEPNVIALNLALMVLGVASAALGPSRKAAAIRPADAMRIES